MRRWTMVMMMAAWIACKPVLVIEIAREGVTTGRTTEIASHQGIKLNEYNDTLSEYGRQQQYLLGLEMRVRYNQSLLGGECNPLNVFGYSVSKESVMLSGQVHLFGLCPLYSNKNITKELVEKSYPPFDFPTKRKIGDELGLHSTPHNFLPLPLHSTYNDPVFGAEESDQYPLPLSELHGSDSEKTIDKAFKDSLYKYIAKLAGRNAKAYTATNIVDSVQELLSLVERGRMKGVSKGKLKEARKFVYEYFRHYWGKENKRKYSAMFFNEVVLKLKNAVTIRLNKVLDKKLEIVQTIEQPDYDKNKVKFFLFEVGDLQMYTYLEMLRLGRKKYIPPSSILVFELVQKCKLKKEMEVEEAMGCFTLHLKFNDEDVSSPLCKSPCELAGFVKKLKKRFGDLLKV